MMNRNELGDDPKTAKRTPNLAVPFYWNGPSEALQDACAGSGWSIRHVVSTEIVKEHTGKRRTLRFGVVAAQRGATQGYTWYGKEYRGAKGERTFQKLRALHPLTPEGIRVPEPLAYSPRARLVVTAALDGLPLADALKSRSRPDATSLLTRVGAAIAQLHALGSAMASGESTTAFGHHGPKEESDVLRLARERLHASPGAPAAAHQSPGVQRLGPALLERFRAACDLVETELLRGRSRASNVPPESALLHRDLYPEQVVMGTGWVGFLDLDEAAFGEPELDLGNLDAHLILADLQRAGTVETAIERIAALHAGYTEHGTADSSRVGTYTASSLLRLASLERLGDPSVSALDWPRLAEELIKEALFHTQLPPGAPEPHLPLL